ncbi:MAG TPA: hypothetical protein VGH38_02785 [Bryobacteraceae bacterium]
MAEKRKPWDLTSTHALEGAAEWIRKSADATVVMVVRGHDFAFAVAGDCAPSDAAELVGDLLPEMVEETNLARAAKREAETRKRAAQIAGHHVV